METQLTTPPAKKRFPIWKTILFSFIALLIVARLILPFVVLKYVNKVLSEIEGYKGKVDDIDIWLIRGAYVIKGLTIEKIDNKIPIPFISADAIDLSVEWKALFKGGIKSEVVFKNPKLNFVAGPAKSTTQTGAETDWTESLKKLLPLEINRFEIQNGTITYNDFHASPKVKVDIHSLNLVATNLSNLENPDKKLPSTLFVEGTSIGDGHLLLTGNMNVLKKVPDADINMKFTDISLRALNDFSTAYGKFDFNKGKLSVYSELSLSDKNLNGYVKPVMENVDILNWEDKEKPFLRKLWEGVVGSTIKVLKNHPKDRFATKVPIEGKLDKIDTNVFDAIINVLKNCFVRAFPKEVDDTIAYGKSEEKQDKKRKFLFFNVGKKEDKKDKK